jgi:hypothetical protein
VGNGSREENASKKETRRANQGRRRAAFSPQANGLLRLAWPAAFLVNLRDYLTSYCNNLEMYVFGNRQNRPNRGRSSLFTAL